MTCPNNWIAGAIKRKGALTAKAKKAGALTAKGTIDSDWLAQKSQGDSQTAKQARLAATMRRFSKR